LTLHGSSGSIPFAHGARHGSRPERHVLFPVPQPVSLPCVQPYGGRHTSSRVYSLFPGWFPTLLLKWTHATRTRAFLHRLTVPLLSSNFPRTAANTYGNGVLCRRAAVCKQPGVGLAIPSHFPLVADAGPDAQNYSSTPTSNATRLSLCAPFADTIQLHDGM
jgi:hypothetical protein